MFAQMPNTDYQFVAASQDDLPLGPTGNNGDILEKLIVIPGTTGAGTISITDGTAGTDTNVFVAGTLSDLKPFVIQLGMRSKAAGGWVITTGANVTVIAVGRFT